MNLLPALLLLLAIACGSPSAKEPASPQDRATALAQALCCAACEGKTVADSTAPAAEPVRARIDQMIADGADDAAIRAWFVARYGDWILSTPPTDDATGVPTCTGAASAGRPILGKPLPALTLTDLDGAEHPLSELKGKPTVLNFWATWCGPCKLESPLLRYAATKHPEVRFLGVVYLDEPEAARRLTARDQPGYPSLIDPDATLALELGLTGVPETYFIDAEGVVRAHHLGPLHPDTLAAKLAEVTASD